MEVGFVFVMGKTALFHVDLARILARSLPKSHETTATLVAGQCTIALSTNPENTLCHVPK
jgi:hypothetical protein